MGIVACEVSSREEVSLSSLLNGPFTLHAHVHDNEYTCTLMHHVWVTLTTTIINAPHNSYLQYSVFIIFVCVCGWLWPAVCVWVGICVGISVSLAIWICLILLVFQAFCMLSLFLCVCISYGCLCVSVWICLSVWVFAWVFGGWCHFWEHCTDCLFNRFSDNCLAVNQTVFVEPILIILRPRPHPAVMSKKEMPNHNNAIPNNYRSRHRYHISFEYED